MSAKTDPATLREEGQLLAAAGQALYGSSWAALVAQETCTPPPMLTMAVQGRRRVSWRIWEPLAALMERRVVTLSQLAVRPDPEEGQDKHACFAELGAMLYGPYWKRPMADDLVELAPELFRSESDRPHPLGMVAIPGQKVARYVRKGRPIPDEFWHALRQVAARRVVQLRRLRPLVLRKAADVEG